MLLLFYFKLWLNVFLVFGTAVFLVSNNVIEMKKLIIDIIIFIRITTNLEY